MATEGNAEHVGLHPSVSTAASRNTSHDVIDLTDSPPQVVDREGTTEVGKDLVTASPLAKHKQFKQESLDDPNNSLPPDTAAEPTLNLGTQARYTDAQKAFVAHHGRYCKPSKLIAKFEIQFGTETPATKESLPSLREYYIKKGDEQTLLNQAASYDWYSLIMAPGQEKAAQIMSLEDCNEEHRAFLVHHANHGVYRLRIVEVFNTQFMKGITKETINDVLSTLVERGDEPKLQQIALTHDWKEAYLPKRPTAPKAKIEKTKAEAPRRPSKSEQIPVFTHEQRVFLLWMSRRKRTREEIYHAFRYRFRDIASELNMKRVLSRAKSQIDETDTLVNEAQGYSWWRPDALKGEPNFNIEEQLRKRVQAKRRMLAGINMYAPDFEQEDQESRLGTVTPEASTPPPQDSYPTPSTPGPARESPEPRSGPQSPNIDAVRAATAAAPALHIFPWQRAALPMREVYSPPVDPNFPSRNVQSDSSRYTLEPYDERGVRETYTPPLLTNLPSFRAEPHVLQDPFFPQRHRHQYDSTTLSMDSQRSASPGRAEKGSHWRRRD